MPNPLKVKQKGKSNLKFFSNHLAVTKVQGAAIAAIIIVAAIATAAYYAMLPNPSPSPSPSPTPTPKPTPKPTPTSPAPASINVENIGGKYNANLSFWEDHTEMEYADESGKHSELYFDVEIRSGLDWIKTNTPENATFLCWWDYGHMIKGYAERNVVVRNPSNEILESIANPSGIKEFDPHEKILDVATALATSDFTETSRILDKYNVTHVLVSSDDLIKAYWFFKIAGMNPTDYLLHQDSSWTFTEAGKQTMISKLLENRDTGFTLIYEDQEIKVYKLD